MTVIRRILHPSDISRASAPAFVTALRMARANRAELRLVHVLDPNEDVRKAIERALERRAEREARRIRVDVHDGAVTLTGTVHTWAERKSVLAAARFTRGVRSLEDRLKVEPV